MDGKLVSGSPSALEDSERKNSLSSFTYTEKFYELFPYYLSLGMTYDLYWNDNPELAKYYRKADEIRNERRNQELWLQGMYIYEALCDVSPVLHAFAKKGTKPAPYSTSPYPLTEKARKNDRAVSEHRVAEKGKKVMEAFMKATNARFKESSNNKGGESIV